MTKLTRRKFLHRKLLEIKEALGRREGLADNYCNLGNFYFNCGDLDRAEEMYDKSLALNQALGRREGLVESYRKIGEVYHVRGDFDRAEKMYRMSLEIVESLGYFDSLQIHLLGAVMEEMANNYCGLGEVYQARGDFDRAEEMYLKSMELFGKIRRIIQMSEVEVLLDDLRKRR